MGLIPSVLPQAGYGRAHGAKPSADAAAWLDAHRDQIIECARHNGLARLTLRACAERYRRAVRDWVESLPLHENDKHPLRLSFAVCGACPTGASSAFFHDRLAG